MVSLQRAIRTRAAGAAVLWAIASACGGGGSSSGSGTTNTSGGMMPTSPSGPNTPAIPANTVLATPSNTFDPGTLTVARGTSVTFTFQNVGHNVFFDAAGGAPANIPEVLSNTSVARTFSTTGSFAYECHVHLGMRGTVIVQ